MHLTAKFSTKSSQVSYRVGEEGIMASPLGVTSKWQVPESWCNPADFSANIFANGVAELSPAKKGERLK